MLTISIPKIEYNNLLERQKRFEEELRVLKMMIQDEVDESRIRPSVLRRWDRISHDLDKGKGLVFSSAKEALLWLKNI